MTGTAAGQPRRLKSKISSSGITYIEWRNPFMVAWWSAAFPGFGHYLLGQYLRATFLTLAEVLMNTLARVNEALVYSFSGNFRMAAEVVDPRWVYGYMLVYLLAMWDSYRSALQNNKLVQLAELENTRIRPFYIGKSEIHYLEKKSPLKAAIFSFGFPGMGQMYNHRIGLAAYAMTWWFIYISLSNFYIAALELVYGNIAHSTQLLRPHWLLFMPSVIGGSIYHAFITSLEHNRLFRIEQIQYFRERYGRPTLKLFSKTG